MVGLHRPVFRSHRRPFDQRQQVALDAFAADRPAAHVRRCDLVDLIQKDDSVRLGRSEEHTSELQSLMRISYAVFCLKKKTKYNHNRLCITYITHKTQQSDNNK